jgi:hypothetical protein
VALHFLWVWASLLGCADGLVLDLGVVYWSRLFFDEFARGHPFFVGLGQPIGLRRWAGLFAAWAGLGSRGGLLVTFGVRGPLADFDFS